MDKINIQQIFEDSKKIYEISSEIKMLQGDLDNMLSAIEKNELDYQKGSIPKDFFDPAEEKLKKESAVLIKKMNALVENGINLVGKMKSEMKKYEITKKSKEKERPDGINQKNRL